VGGGNADLFGSIFNIALSQQRGDRLFHLSAEFGAVSLHASKPAKV
jgi:hypothetical protein